MTFSSFSLSSFEIPLIQEIKKHPCLYNYHLPEYNRKDTTEDAWNKVSKNLAFSVNECKDKWKNIRSSYVRSLKVVSGKLRKPYYLADHLHFVLPFLKIGVEVDAIEEGSLINMSQPRTPTQQYAIDEGDVEDNHIVKLEHVESDNDQTDDFSFNNPLPEVEDSVTVARHENRPRKLRKKRKLVNLKNYVQRRDNKRFMPTARPDNNAMRYFLLSLLPELESMNEDQIRQFKIKVMLLIDEIKTDTGRVTRMSSFTESEKLQKKLINLLVKNLDND